MLNTLIYKWRGKGKRLGRFYVTSKWSNDCLVVLKYDWTIKRINKHDYNILKIHCDKIQISRKIKTNK